MGHFLADRFFKFLLLHEGGHQRHGRRNRHDDGADERQPAKDNSARAKGKAAAAFFENAPHTGFVFVWDAWFSWNKDNNI